MKKISIIFFVLIVITIKTNAQWTPKSSGPTNRLFSVCFTNANTAYAVGDFGTILKTTNVGSGAEEYIVNEYFNIYPNPASDIITLKTNYRNNKDLTLNIYTIMGVLVKSEILQENQQELNTGDLSNGVYLVEITSKEITG